jgi:hypothetical protein
MSLLQDYHFLAHRLTVYVFSLDGWSWAIAWAQLGVGCINCVPLTDTAALQLDELIAEPAMAARLRRTPLPESNELGVGTVFSLHVTASQAAASAPEWGSLQRTLTETQGAVVQLVTVGSSKAFQEKTWRDLGRSMIWQEMRHRTLGGLTSARVLLGWRGPHSESAKPEPGKRRNPMRPLGRFLEPSVKLNQWRKGGTNTDCWAPCRDGAVPFSLPWGPGEPWVEAPTCLLRPERGVGGVTAVTFVQRPMTIKERAQLMDVREDWAKVVVPAMWHWDSGLAPPLRLLVESTMAMLEWLRKHVGTGANETVTGARGEGSRVDWGRVRAPWLGGTPETTGLERMAYFGWIWGTTDAEAAVATRDDDAGVDLSLWAIGGEGTEMEDKRACLRRFLFRCWIRRTCHEARQWLMGEEARGGHKKNTEAVRDCTRRLANSDWWD